MARTTTPLSQAADRRIVAGVAMGLAQVVVGALLVAAGVGLWLTADAGVGPRRGMVAAAAVCAGLALVAGPWWWRLSHDLAEERRERIRIQERELRAWLYGSPEPPNPDESLAAALQRVSDEVEDVHGVNVETVLVGDCALDDRLRAMMQSSREALSNAARHSGATAVSAFLEVEPDQVTVFVRDRGAGFDLAAVDDDRHGVRGSIILRMQRHGGKAEIRSTPGEGTEVRLSMPYRPRNHQSASESGER